MSHPGRGQQVDPVERRPLCTRCGYDLRGRESGACPECGGGFELTTVFAQADAAVRQRWRALQAVLLVSVFLGLLVPVAFIGLVCGFWPLPAALFFAASVGIVQELAWRGSARGRRMLAATTPGLRLDYTRAVRRAATLYGIVLVVWIVGLMVLVV